MPQVAVIGCGAWGKNLVRNFSELGALRGVCDIDTKRAKEIAEQYEVPFLAEAEIYADPTIDAVVIVSSASAHFAQAKAALQAGKHVYVEKPLVLASHEAKELCDLAKAKNKILMVGHILNYHPAFMELKKRLSELGSLKHIYANRLGLGRLIREEGVLWDLACHDVSLLLSLVGEFPDSVESVDQAYYNGKAMSTLLNMTFSEGPTAHVHVSWASPFKEQKLVVVGEKGVAVFDDCKPWAEKLRISKGLISLEDQRLLSNQNFQTEVISLPESEPLKNECEHFLQCIEAGDTPITSGEEGLQVVTLLEDAENTYKRKDVI